MLHPSTKRLIDKLAAMTADHAIAWTDGEDGAVVYDTEGYRVALTEDPQDFVLFDPLGKELERATVEDLSAAQTEDGRLYSALIAEVRAEALRVARGTEQAIDRVLAGLERAAAGETIEELAEAVAEAPQQDAIEAQTDETDIAAAEDVSEPADVEMAVQRLADDMNSPARTITETRSAEPEPERDAPADAGASVSKISAVAGLGGAVFGAAAASAGDVGEIEAAAAEPTPETPDPASELVQSEDQPAEASVLPVIEDEPAPANGETAHFESVAAEAPEPTETEVLAEANEALTEPFAGSAEAILETAHNAFASISDTAESAGETAAGATEDAADAVADVSEKSTAAVGGFVSDAAAEAADAVDNVTDFPGGVAESVSDGAEAALDAAGDAAATAGSVLGGIGSAIGDAAEEAVDSAGKVVSDADEDEGDVKTTTRFNPWN